MVVLVPVVILSCVAGIGAVLAVRRWPRLDSGAPRLDASRSATRRRLYGHPHIEAMLRQRVDPAAITGLALTLAVVLLVGAVAGVGLLLVMAQHNVGLAQFDKSFARWGADNETSFSTSVLKLISQLGGTLGVIVVAVAVAAVELRRHRTYAVVGFLVLTVAGQFAVTALIKGGVARARPDIHQLTGFSGSSFPSGHAAAAAATYAAAALLLGRRRSWSTRTALAGLAAAIAVAVASTRVLLGVHWFTDVIAGLALGWAWFALCSIAFGGHILRFGAPVAAAEQAAAAKPSARRESTAA